MALNAKLGSLSTTVIVLFASYLYYLLAKAPEAPKLEEAWWDEGDEGKDDISIRPFKINVTTRELQDLELRLNISRPPTPSLETTHHEYGLNPKVLYKYLHILKTEYNFTERQDFLNQFPQFTTQIQGLTIHFLHIVPDNPEKLPVFPILLLHGWPSSVIHFTSMIPSLTKQTNHSFLLELVIPSLPGFGYSSAPRKPNFQAHNIAHVFLTLMRRLNHERFYVHGNDWGGIVGAHLTTLFPEAVLGFHSNFCFSLRYISLVKIILGSLYPPLIVAKESENKLYPLFDYIRFCLTENGYYHVQGTKPDSIGLALDNSLEGLLSYVLEKFSVAANKDNIHLPDAGLDKYNTTTLLDIILFYYWFPKTSTTSSRLYAENINVKVFEIGVHNLPIDKSVPCGCAFFEHEFMYQPESILRDKFTNLMHYNTYKSVGHFAALEGSDLLVKDIISFVSKTLN
ncbi:juvenile hormone epoxide hydrolase-like [Anoplophora glabripennis]|uniref:juvenile hormone epoxide hydrolase-like n=1 Tax=Anoplophora glabripennis TaxID=217634 RepID=UPI000873CA9C|nr:juvenile hormone epoxide hydrolase-like [Anoplophora glabripennis]